MRILAPSIIDPRSFRGGAGTATRGLYDVLESEPLGASIELLPSLVPKSRWRHALRRGTCALRSLTSPLPSKVLFQLSRAYLSSLRSALDRNDYDLVLINGTDLLWVVDLVAGRAPVIAWVHNLEHELYARQLKAIGLPRIARRLMDRDRIRLEAFEVDRLTRVDGAMFLSSREASRMQPLLPKQDLLCVPPLLAYPARPESLRRLPGRRIELGFLGNVDWWPNRDALHWFLAEILPRCDEHVRLNIFGFGSERYGNARVRQFRPDTVVGHGYVADIEKVWSACDLMICPIRTGGGVNIKLAEAVYNGLPVLATSFAVDGLPLIAGPALSIVAGADKWVEFLNSSALRGLAVAEVPPDQRDQFSTAHHREVIHNYFRRVAMLK